MEFVTQVVHSLYTRLFRQFIYYQSFFLSISLSCFFCSFFLSNKKQIQFFNFKNTSTFGSTFLAPASIATCYMLVYIPQVQSTNTVILLSLILTTCLIPSMVHFTITEGINILIIRYDHCTITNFVSFNDLSFLFPKHFLICLSNLIQLNQNVF